MSDTKAQPEPTMEEILASIRRIISENDEQGAPGAAPAAAKAPVDNVLELTEMVADDGSVVSLNTPFGDPDVNDNLVEDDEDEDDESGVDVDDDDDDDEIPPLPDEELAEEPEVAMEDDKVEFSSDETIGQAKPKGLDDGLMSAASAGAATAAFAALARSAQQSGNSGMALGSGRTLEDLVQEMIRPMIKEWLDKNLPPMAERLVRKELERLSRRAEE